MSDQASTAPLPPANKPAEARSALAAGGAMAGSAILLPFAVALSLAEGLAQMSLKARISVDTRRLIHEFSFMPSTMHKILGMLCN